MKSGPARRVRREVADCHVHSLRDRRKLRSPCCPPTSIAAIELFAGLVHADRERLAQAAADVHLRPGEYAVHEGEERALFAVISGKIEVTKRMEGGEKTIGWRLPGSIFGEVPITLGASFPGSFRASEPTRVLRLDARQYYVIAAAAPQVAVAVGTLARERLGGLQGLAAKPPTPQVTVIGHRWDPACHDLRRFLARNQVVFDWLTPESPALSARWPRWTTDEPGPALGFPDGRFRRPATAPGRGEPAGPPDRAALGPVRHHHRGRRPGRAGRGGLRRLRGARDPGGGARGTRRAGRDLVAD